MFMIQQTNKFVFLSVKLWFRSYKGNSRFGYTVTFSDSVISKAADRSITKNGIVLKKGNDVILPLTDDNKIFIAYSENGCDGKWSIPDAEFAKAEIYNITVDGNEHISDVTIENKTISMKLNAGQAVVIKCIE